jgi:hypothetical protein
MTKELKNKIMFEIKRAAGDDINVILLTSEISKIVDEATANAIMESSGFGEMFNSLGLKIVGRNES